MCLLWPNSPALMESAMLPMAVCGATPVEVEAKVISGQAEWSWMPKTGDGMCSVYSAHSNRTTSRQTNSKQVDHGTQY